MSLFTTLSRRFLVLTVGLAASASTSAVAGGATKQDEIGYRPQIEVPARKPEVLRPPTVRELGSKSKVKEFDPSRYRTLEVPKLDEHRAPSKVVRTPSRTTIIRIHNTKTRHQTSTKLTGLGRGRVHPAR
jgi:hypothetical protein